ncbi:respiratory nitrate reductase subunit gamma [Fredinandcohnia sp. 179-A 10B2 NHS]|uniref:respiratory nitrate reductase subunit gamma n=1 Tax=Fredinandcohnia sp. 179-A 10B2 NHS TaxID=3235176 RepID=UPI00399F5BB4
MKLIDMILWMIIPYTVVLLIIMGMIWRDRSKDKNRSKRINHLFLFFLLLFAGTGTVILLTLHNDLTVILSWTKGLLTMNPQIEMMYTISPLALLHILSLFAILLLLPFTGFPFNKQVVLEIEENEENLVVRW